MYYVYYTLSEDNVVNTDTWEVEVKAQRRGYYVNCNDVDFKADDYVVVAAERGEDIGRAKWQLPGDFKIKGSPMAIIRTASEHDFERCEENRRKEKETLDQCLEFVKKHNLEMKLVDAECQLDGNKLTFYFTADHRIDFRELVKDLAGIYKTRIELRQIGVRDEAKRLGGFGICGLTQCCSTWLRDFEPISTQLAREQNLSLNPQKISGNCGRLLCCLQYEKNHYRETLRSFPSLGSKYRTELGEGIVDKLNIFTQEMIVRHQSGDDEVVRLKDVQRRRCRKSSFFTKIPTENNDQKE
jgi:cell fate regulator YaaT (PSP1 superfamily)